MNPNDLSNTGFTLTQKALGLYLVVVKSKCDSPVWAPDHDMCSTAITIHAPQPPVSGTPPQTNCIVSGENGCSSTKPCCNDAKCIGLTAGSGQAENGLCVSSTSISDLTNNGSLTFDESFQSPPAVCDTNGSKYICHTAIGDIDTSVGGLIDKLLGLVLSIAGAIVILLIIISGYRLMMSQGNPEMIKDAREQLTAAIVGLLFVIFSLVILQIIGFNILGLPGFGK
jgi:hypothetical protein